MTIVIYKRPSKGQETETGIILLAHLRSRFPGAVLVALCCATNVGVASLVISLAINYRKKHLPNSLLPSDPLPHNIAFACRFVSWL